ncbi:MAG: hypothetical protein LUC34_02110 [Campylobacter sp.]|nr:hypothetical protein [Campylobacter sp.]
MKDAEFLIEHIYKNPLFKELKSANECRKLVSFMSKTHQNLIAFCYVRGNIIFFALKHPLALQELKRDSSIFMIKDLLKAFVKTDETSIFKSVEEIKFFITNNLKFQPQISKPIKISRPQSKGEFQNFTKDEILHSKFEEIRAVLLARNAKFYAN